MNIQHEFEYWLRRDLSWKLYLSKSKQVAMDIEFYGFANYAAPLAMKAPKEFRLFFDEFKRIIDKVHKWKCRSDQYISPAMNVDEEGNVKFGKYPNGKMVYKLYLKNRVEK